MKILLEGRPGAGKSTVARRLADLLLQDGKRIGGFLTEELREHGRRVGFCVEAFGGERATLAHVSLPGPRGSVVTASTWRRSSESRWRLWRQSSTRTSSSSTSLARWS